MSNFSPLAMQGLTLVVTQNVVGVFFPSLYRSPTLPPTPHLPHNLPSSVDECLPVCSTGLQGSAAPQLRTDSFLFAPVAKPASASARLNPCFYTPEASFVCFVLFVLFAFLRTLLKVSCNVKERFLLVLSGDQKI